MNCIGFYYIKDSMSGPKKDNKWIKANLDINAQIDRYMLEIKPVLDDDDIYDEDEDERTQRLPRRIKLTDYKACEPRGSQSYNNFKIHLLALSPKLFSKAKKLLLAFFSEEVQICWYKHLETILTHKFHNINSTSSNSISQDSSSLASLEQFMIENDVYEGSLMPGEYLASIIENTKAKECSLKGRYILAITETGLNLKDEDTDEIVRLWEMKNIRKFGEKDNIFSVELGKFCEDGEGFLSFKVDKGKQLMQDMMVTKENCLKNRRNRKSVLKSNDDLMYPSSMSNNGTGSLNVVGQRNTFMCENKLYSANEEIKQSSLFKKMAFEPPTIAPPPIPIECSKEKEEPCD